MTNQRVANYYTDVHSVIQHRNSSSLSSVFFSAASSVSNNKPFLLLLVIHYFLVLICLLKIFRGAHMKVMNTLIIIMSIFIRSKPGIEMDILRNLAGISDNSVIVNIVI